MRSVLSKDVLHVIVMSPPMDRSGGIESLYRYAKGFFPSNVRVQYVDTRGYSKSPWKSLFPLIFAIRNVTISRLARDVDVVHLNLSAYGSTIRKMVLLAWCTFFLRVPCVVQLHASSFGVYMESLPKPFRRLIVFLLNRSALILVLGNTWRQLLISLGCDPRKVQVFAMGVPDLFENKMNSSSMYQQLGGAPVLELFFAGRLTEAKGVVEILESMALPQMSNVRLVLAGPGDFEYWRDQSIRLGVSERVAFIGTVPSEIIHQLLNLSDVLVLPSKAEALPVVVLEALSAGKTIVCSAVGAIPEFIREEEEGILLTEVSANAIAEAVHRVLNPTLRRHLESQARALWIEHFNVAKTSAELALIWREASSTFLMGEKHDVA